jgi:hypothetical protein
MEISYVNQKKITWLLRASDDSPGEAFSPQALSRQELVATTKVSNRSITIFGSTKATS